MNGKKIIGIVVGVAIVAFLVIRLKNNKDVAQRKVYQYDKAQAVNVRTDTLRLESIAPETYYSGTFEPNKETKVSAEIQGKINALLVDIGSVVRKGQPLALLDNVLLKLQLQAAELQVEGLEADVNRYTILAAADAIQGVQLEKAALGLRSAKVQCATLAEQLKKTTVRAPFDGVVTAKLSEEGAFAAPGVPLLQITDIGRLKFSINVSESDLKQFALHQQYPITADAYPEIALVGEAVMTGSKANVGSSFPVQFAVANTPDLKIKSGMFGKVMRSEVAPAQGIVIASSALVGTASEPQVYLVKDRKAVLHRITISKKLQNKIVVSGGVGAGDVIVTSGFINLFDGASVTDK